jgi:hypothetical protein
VNKNFLGITLLYSILLAACNPAPEYQAPSTVASAAATQASTAAADTATATEAPTATETQPENLIQLGDLQLVPFAPPWFEGDMTTTVFAENGLLRIDSPEETGEPGVNQVTGAVTTASYNSFDISASFNPEGGPVCNEVIETYGLDYVKTTNIVCANIHVSNCIIFDFVDPENTQTFCIDGSARFWTLIAYENGEVIFHSSVQPSDAIHDTGLVLMGAHSLPNEIRMTLQDGELTAFINGEEVFTREDPTSLVGYDAAGEPVYRTDGWESEPINGQIGAGCVNLNLDPYFSLANCEIKLVLNP